MKQTPFDPQTDLAPLPFESDHCELAAALKAAGLPWRPHVGCFVWDPDRHIPAPYPFPNRIYFILNLGRFRELLGDDVSIKEKLVWLPTWHQARELLNRMGVDPEEVRASVNVPDVWRPGRDLLALYALLKDRMR